ncbi:MAG: division/cell wall cluster transcriptional repressor MraZ [Oscillospiraceae bacterium]|nr:division/cell wall cluster transcriptional repressor MraZ [Oscillospiraceae bacterium]
MTGVYQHNLDAKGRLFIPAKLREELGETFYVTLSMEKCLSVYSSESWDVFMERTKAMPKTKQIKMRPLFAHAAKCELDNQGRILLPQALRDFAGLKKEVTVVGAGECAELWDSAAWSAVDVAETTPENIAEVFTELDF